MVLVLAKNQLVNLAFYFYKLKAGVRQGGVLSPILFGTYIDNLVNLVDKTNKGCQIGAICTGIFLYADDRILLAPSIQALQSLISLCKSELNFLCMAVNAKNLLVCVLVLGSEMHVQVLRCVVAQLTG